MLLSVGMQNDSVRSMSVRSKSVSAPCPLRPLSKQVKFLLYVHSGKAAF